MCRQAPTPAAASSPSSPLLSACLQTKAGLKFERVGAPQPSDMASVAAERAVSAVQEVDASVLPIFRGAAAKLLEVGGWVHGCCCSC